MQTYIIRTLLLFLLVKPALALDATDSGIYAVVHRDGHITEKVMRFVQIEKLWRVEDQKPDGTWKDITCERDCTLTKVAPYELPKLFPGADLGKIAPSCVQNFAFAFCSYVPGAVGSQRSYVLVALVTPGPVHINLVRISQ